MPVYYNAWLYDNHSDPLMSLLYVIIKKCGLWIDSKLVKDKTDKLKDIIKSIQVNLGIFSINGDKVIDAFSEKNIFEDIQLAEDIRKSVKEIFNQVIEEQTQKLVIFIDELDRCKPSYALEMLERIKHYFDDNRIIFIVSVNKEQLTHTISNYYGNGFDSTGYLNKFFNYEIYLPPVQTIDKTIGNSNINQYWLRTISNTLVKYYRLSLRDTLIFKQRIEQFKDDEMIFNNKLHSSARGYCMSLFIPLLIVLRMKDIEEARKFEDGESELFEILENVSEVKEYFEEYGDNGYEKIKAVYKFVFKEENESILQEVNLGIADVGRNVKKECFRQMGLRNI